MTRDEWNQVKEALNSFYHIVKMNADGYDLALKLERMSTYKNAIGIYINGEFHGKWLMDDCEERRRFCQSRQRSLLNAKGRAAIKKMSKKQQAEWIARSTYTYHASHWSSFGSLKRHLIANNQSIELISIT